MHDASAASLSPSDIEQFTDRTAQIAAGFESHDLVECDYDVTEFEDGSSITVSVGPADIDWAETGQTPPRTLITRGASAFVRGHQVRLNVTDSTDVGADAIVRQKMALDYTGSQTASETEVLTRTHQQSWSTFIEDCLELFRSRAGVVVRHIERHERRLHTLYQIPRIGAGQQVSVTDVQVNWYHGYSNEPHLVAYVDGPAPRFEPLAPIDTDSFEQGFSIQRNGSLIQAFHIGEQATVNAEEIAGTTPTDRAVAAAGRDEPGGISSFPDPISACHTWAAAPVIPVEVRSRDDRISWHGLSLPIALELIDQYCNGHLGSDNADTLVGDSAYEVLVDADDRDAYSNGPVALQHLPGEDGIRMVPTCAAVDDDDGSLLLS